MNFVTFWGYNQLEKCIRYNLKFVSFESKLKFFLSFSDFYFFFNCRNARQSGKNGFCKFTAVVLD